MEFDEMVELIEKNQEAANNAVEPWQAEITTGDYFIRVYSRELVIYGVVVPLKYEEDEQLFATERMKYVRFTRCYSPLVPDGEFGNTHVSTMTIKISQDQFEAARKAGWPSDIRAVHSLINMVKGGEA